MRHFSLKTLAALFLVVFPVISAAPVSPPGAAQTGGRGAAEAARESSEAERLSREGPQFPARLDPSNFTVKAFVKGGWPIYIAYELRRPGFVTLQINFVNFPDCPPYFHTFGGPRGGMFTLSERYTDGRVMVGTFTVKATSKEGGRGQRVPLRLFAIGAGPQAVGSSGFDRVSFQPDLVLPRRGQQANYSFHAIRDFPLVTADIYRDGDMELVARKEHPGGVRRNQSAGGVWDGKARGSPSIGLHTLLVRGWRTLGEGGDWMATSSNPQVVLVR